MHIIKNCRDFKIFWHHKNQSFEFRVSINLLQHPCVQPLGSRTQPSPGVAHGWNNRHRGMLTSRGPPGSSLGRRLSRTALSSPGDGRCQTKEQSGRSEHTTAPEGGELRRAAGAWHGRGCPGPCGERLPPRPGYTHLLGAASGSRASHHSSSALSASQVRLLGHALQASQPQSPLLP